ncbi:uncharacterized protein LOC119635869 [Glossina fuscipes]|uniref:Uncharacterized protein LOC119635869 n=1 Tax=Glossina fuscipes TaxID=7396 RepID=A0A9C5Z2J2_9MUSC|nr:uncharacterized protein LOC119635869 [Glossina fuscipes]
MTVSGLVLLYYSLCTHQTLLQVCGYGTSSRPNGRFWFQCFKSGNDMERPGGPSRYEDNKWRNLIGERAARTLKKLSNNSAVEETPVSRRLNAMGIIQKGGKMATVRVDEVNVISNRVSIAAIHIDTEEKYSWP